MKKITNILLIIAIICNYFILPITVNAATITATIIDPDGVNVRNGPGTNNTKIGVLAFKKQITLVSTTKHKGTGCSKGWYQINYNGSTKAYVCSELVTINNENTTTNNKTYYTTSEWGTRINEDYANVRKSTSMSATALDKLFLGTKVNILETINTSTSGCSEGWYKISYYNNKTGYVCKRLIDKYEDVTASDKDYEKQLKTLGFPDSYIPFLVYLHKKHPNWNFKPDLTKKDFATAVNKETGKNYIQTNIDIYRTSNTAVESGTWYIASSPVVAIFLDPRNYLNEKNIWVYEDLTYDEKATTYHDTVKSIFANTYLDTEEYIGYFLEGGKESMVSPVHLAARVKQEGGTNEKYDGVSGKSTLKYDGKALTNAYNYYNIGAYEDSKTKSAVARGLAVAKGYVDNYYGTPWDTREKAIKYGAKFIGDKYVSKKQNTLYYQKFNTANNSYYAPYTNQYMTNVMAPASESLSINSTKKNNNIADLTYTFAIPVYDNTPQSYLTYPPLGDTINDLTSIKVNNTTVNGFDSDVLEYTHYISYDTTEVSLTADKKSAKSTVKGTGTIKTPNANTKVQIIVTSEVLETKTYTITLIKEDKPAEDTLTAEEIINKLDVKLSNNYLTGISSGTLPATLANDINKISPSAKVTITDKNKVKKTSKLATGDIITINNTSYTISIKGDLNGDGTINSADFSRIQKHILKYSTLKNEYKAAADVNYDGNINSADFSRIQKHILKYIKLK